MDFPTMGAAPRLGRVFTPQEYYPNAGRVVIISHGLWMPRFGGDPKMLESNVELSGVPHTIGVMPRNSTWPEDADVIRPDGYSGTPPEWLLRRDDHVMRAIARLRPAVSIEQAQARLTPMAARIAAEHAGRAGTGRKLHSLRDWIVGPAVQQTRWILLGSVLFVLLIACANLANLLLLRGSVRDREIAVRGALGASWAG